MADFLHNQWDAAWQARWWLVGLTTFAAAAWLGAATWWRRRAVRALAVRHRVQVLPSQTFDPSRTEVLGTAPRLHRLPQVAGLLPRRARAVRIRLTSASGLLEYQVHGPKDAAHVLDMPLYAGVEVHKLGSLEHMEVPRIRLTAPRTGTEHRL
jgi:hypothetical protein